MPWPPRQPPRGAVSDEDRAFYDDVIARALIRNPTAEEDAGYYGRLLYSPEFAVRLSSFGRMVRERGDRGDSYSHADREFIDQVLAKVLGTNVVMRMHIPDAISAGVRIEAIDAIHRGERAALTPREALLYEFAQAMVLGHMTGQLWESVEELMGARGTTELAIFTLFLQLTMRLEEAVGMGIGAPTDDEVQKIIGDLMSGDMTAPDFRERIN